MYLKVCKITLAIDQTGKRLVRHFTDFNVGLGNI